MKELQKTVFFAAYDSVIFSSGRTMTDKEQKEMLRCAILGTGDPDAMTLPEQMVLGINQFANLYDDVPIETNADRNASSSHHAERDITGTDNAGSTGSSRRNEYDKRLKDCFFPQKSSGGKLNIYANKPDGITRALLVAKNFTNPVDVSVQTIMRAAKEVLRNGRKALACAKDSESEYKDGTLPSGKTIADYHRYIRERMFVKLKGSIGDSDDAVDDDDILDRDSEPNSEQSITAASPDDMPEDYYFSGMIAFFLWGHIVEDECYKSKQFQIGDTVSDNEQRGGNGRRQVKKEYALAETKQRDGGGGAVASPFRRGTTLSQQIEIAKLQAARLIEERRSLENDYSTALLNIQTEIDNRMEMAKLWQVSDRNDSIFLEMRELMAEKQKLSVQFAKDRSNLNSKHQATDDIIDLAVGYPATKRSKSNSSTSSSTGATPGSRANTDSTLASTGGRGDGGIGEEFISPPPSRILWSSSTNDNDDKFDED